MTFAVPAPIHPCVEGAPLPRPLPPGSEKGGRGSLEGPRWPMLVPKWPQIAMHGFQCCSTYPFAAQDHIQHAPRRLQSRPEAATTSHGASLRRLRKARRPARNRTKNQRILPDRPWLPAGIWSLKIPESAPRVPTGAKEGHWATPNAQERSRGAPGAPQEAVSRPERSAAGSSLWNQLVSALALAA